ncbi:hypothetical protein [Companilactobacillus ginsenosidimutans]|nr:hypothetical protein [Companilactobacillus ginsenosidimutans]
MEKLDEYIEKRDIREPGFKKLVQEENEKLQSTFKKSDNGKN